jgi:hypothetical protein
MTVVRVNDRSKRQVNNRGRNGHYGIDRITEPNSQVLLATEFELICHFSNYGQFRLLASTMACLKSAWG